jgi:hypothetical protein
MNIYTCLNKLINTVFFSPFFYQDSSYFSRASERNFKHGKDCKRSYVLLLYAVGPFSQRVEGVKKNAY